MSSNDPGHDPGLPIVGWREWLQLPDLGLEWIKCKVDTGARSSCLHAWDIRHELQEGQPWVHFAVHPRQRDDRTVCRCRAAIHEFRRVRSSNGVVEERPVILTSIDLLGQRLLIELTLTNRDQMGFRMLLGREAIRQRFLVDPGRSYCSPVPTDWPRSKRRRR